MIIYDTSKGAKVLPPDMEESITFRFTQPRNVDSKDWKQYQDEMMQLLEAGFFRFKNGSAVCHRDCNGTLKKIEINEVKYNK